LVTAFLFEQSGVAERSPGGATGLPGRHALGDVFMNELIEMEREFLEQLRVHRFLSPARAAPLP